MNCTIFTTTIKNFSNVQSITMPAWDGECEILPQHTESFMQVGHGNIVINTTTNTEVISLAGGFCYVKDDVTIIADIIPLSASASSQALP